MKLLSDNEITIISGAGLRNGIFNCVGATASGYIVGAAFPEKVKHLGFGFTNTFDSTAFATAALGLTVCVAREITGVLDRWIDFQESCSSQDLEVHITADNKTVVY